MNIVQKLSWFLQAGVTETIGEVPVNRLLSAYAHTDIHTASTPTPPTRQPIDDSIALTTAQQIAAQATTLSELYALRAAFDGCPLKKTAANTVNGFGTLSPTLLCITEAPDATEDKEGKLGIGAGGDLLQKMLAAIHVYLNQNAYLTTLTPWRAPGNRQLTATESALCRPFWEKEIALLKPKALLLFGVTPAKALLDIDSLPKARSTHHTYNGIPTFVTIPPTTLLKLPAQKKQAWEDLQKIQKELF